MEGSTLDPRSRAAAGAPAAPLKGIAAALAAPGVGGWLLALLLACCAYAAFASGATAVPDESRLQAGIAAALVLAGLGLATGSLGAARSRLAWAGAGLLAAFALWSAISVGWSPAPDVGWLASNRAMAYAIATAAALVCAPAVRGAPVAFAAGFTLIALCVALYALGGKLAPGLELGPVSLDHTADFSRLRAPIGYWNALGLLLVMATPACIWVAASPKARSGLRLAALLALEILLVALALTYSRGALLAYVLVVAVMVAGGPVRLRRLAVGLVVPIFAAAPIAFVLSRPDLADNGVALAQRSDDGQLLAIVLAGSLLLLAGAARIAGGIERRTRWSERRSRVTCRALAIAAAALVCSAGVLATSERGLGGTVSEEWDKFKQPHAISNDPDRLVSTNSSNRWIWWREAAGAASDKPVAGWGAGSFPTVHLLYREHFTEVSSAHSVPLQFLAEGGVVGAALGLAGIGLLLAAAVKRVRRSRGGERDARLALLTAGCAWAFHCFYDWDWEIPAVTLPALLALAIASAPYGPVGGRAGRGTRRIPGGSLLAGATALVAVALCISAALPSLAEDRRLDALAEVGDDKASLEKARADAALARKLNPFAVNPLYASADIALRSDDDAAATGYLAEAARHFPETVGPWARLLQLQLQGRGTVPLEQLPLVVERLIRGNPLNAGSQLPYFSRLLFSAQVGPDSSPSAYGTPPVRTGVSEAGGRAD